MLDSDKTLPEEQIEFHRKLDELLQEYFPGDAGATYLIAYVRMINDTLDCTMASSAVCIRCIAEIILQALFDKKVMHRGCSKEQMERQLRSILEEHKDKHIKESLLQADLTKN